MKVESAGRAMPHILVCMHARVAALHAVHAHALLPVCWLPLTVAGSRCAAELASHAEAEAATAATDSRAASPAAAAAGAGRTAGADSAAAGTPTPDPLLAAAEQPRATPAAAAAADVERWLEQLRAEHTCVPQAWPHLLTFPAPALQFSPCSHVSACYSMFPTAAGY